MKNFALPGLLVAAALASAQNTARFEPLYREAVERREAEFGAGDLRAIRARIDLAMFLSEHDRPSEAEPLLRGAARALEQIENRGELVRVLVELSKVRLAQGDGDEAESLLRRVFGFANAEARGEIADRLGALMRLKGDLDEAERYSRLALEQRRSADRLRALAVTLEAKGKREEAEELHREALALQERGLGPEHPHVGLSLNSIALLAMERGDIEAAAPLLERALAIFERALGPESAEAATALDNLGNLRRAEQDYDRAERLLRRALDVRRGTLGGDHTDTAATLNNLAGLYHVQGRIREAEPLYREAIRIRSKQLGDSDPETARTFYNLGHLLRQKGDTAGAVNAFSRALKSIEATFGPDDPFVAEIRASLAAVQR